MLRVCGTYRKVLSVIHKWGCRVESPVWRGPLSMGCTMGSAVPSLPSASVCADNRADHLRGHLAVFVPSWLVIFPDWIHDFSDHSLHKLLHSDLQQEGCLPTERAPEGPPEWVPGRCQRTHQQLLVPGKQCEAEEATEGLRLKSCKPPNHVV